MIVRSNAVNFSPRDDNSVSSSSVTTTSTTRSTRSDEAQQHIMSENDCADSLRLQHRSYEHDGLEHEEIATPRVQLDGPDTTAVGPMFGPNRRSRHEKLFVNGSASQATSPQDDDRNSSGVDFSRKQNVYFSFEDTVLEEEFSVYFYARRVQPIGFSASATVISAGASVMFVTSAMVPTTRAMDIASAVLWGGLTIILWYFHIYTDAAGFVYLPRPVAFLFRLCGFSSLLRDDERPSVQENLPAVAGAGGATTNDDYILSNTSSFRRRRRLDARVHEVLRTVSHCVLFVVGLGNVLQNCDNPEVANSLLMCHNTIQGDGLILLPIVASNFLIPLRVPLLIPVYVLGLTAYFMLFAIPGIPYGPSQKQFFSVVVVVATETLVCIGMCMFREERMRQNFTLHIRRHSRGRMVERIRTQVEQMTAVQLPVELLRLRAKEEGVHGATSSNSTSLTRQADVSRQLSNSFNLRRVRCVFYDHSAMVITIATRGFGPWCAKRSPADIVDVLEHVIEGLDQTVAAHPSVRGAGDSLNSSEADLMAMLQVQRVHAFGDVFMVIVTPPLVPTSLTNQSITAANASRKRDVLYNYRVGCASLGASLFQSVAQLIPSALEELCWDDQDTRERERLMPVCAIIEGSAGYSLHRTTHNIIGVGAAVERCHEILRCVDRFCCSSCRSATEVRMVHGAMHCSFTSSTRIARELRWTNRSVTENLPRQMSSVMSLLPVSSESGSFVHREKKSIVGEPIDVPFEDIKSKAQVLLEEDDAPTDYVNPFRSTVEPASEVLPFHHREETEGTVMHEPRVVPRLESTRSHRMISLHLSEMVTLSSTVAPSHASLGVSSSSVYGGQQSSSRFPVREDQRQRQSRRSMGYNTSSNADDTMPELSKASDFSEIGGTTVAVEHALFGAAGLTSDALQQRTSSNTEPHLTTLVRDASPNAAMAPDATSDPWDPVIESLEDTNHVEPNQVLPPSHPDENSSQLEGTSLDLAAVDTAPVAKANQRVVIVSSYFGSLSFADAATENDYVQYVSAYGYDLTDTSITIACSGASLVALLIVCFINRDFDSLGEVPLARLSFFWSSVGAGLSVVFLATSMSFLHSGSPHEKKRGVPSGWLLLFHFLTLLLLQAIYMLVIFNSREGTLVYNTQVVWILVMLNWAIHRPLHQGYVIMLLYDMMIAAAFIFRCIFLVVGELNLLAAFFSVAYFLAIGVLRVLRERSRREIFATEMCLNYQQQEMEADYKILSKALETMVPAGIAGELVKTARKRQQQMWRREFMSRFSGSFSATFTQRDTPQKSLLGGRGSHTQRTPTHRRHKPQRHPVYSTSRSLQTQDLLFCVIELVEEDPPLQLHSSKSGMLTNRGGLSSSDFQQDKTREKTTSLQILALLDQIDDFIPEEVRGKVMTAQCTHNMALLMALPPPKEAKEEKDEERARDLVHAATSVFRELTAQGRNNSASGQHIACKMLLDYGPGIGAVIGKGAVVFAVCCGVSYRAFATLPYVSAGTMIMSSTLYHLFRLPHLDVAQSVVVDSDHTYKEENRQAKSVGCVAVEGSISMRETSVKIKAAGFTPAWYVAEWRI